MSGYYPITIPDPKGWKKIDSDDRVKGAVALGFRAFPYYDGYYQGIYRDRQDSFVWYLIVAYSEDKGATYEPASYHIYTQKASNGPSFPVSGWPPIPARSLFRWGLLGAGLAIAVIGVSILAVGQRKKTKGR